MKKIELTQEEMNMLQEAFENYCMENDDVMESQEETVNSLKEKLR